MVMFHSYVIQITGSHSFQKASTCSTETSLLVILVVQGRLKVALQKLPKARPVESRKVMD